MLSPTFRIWPTLFPPSYPSLSLTSPWVCQFVGERARIMFAGPCLPSCGVDIPFDFSLVFFEDSSPCQGLLTCFLEFGTGAPFLSFPRSVDGLASGLLLEGGGLPPPPLRSLR